MKNEDSNVGYIKKVGDDTEHPIEIFTFKHVTRLGAYVVPFNNHAEFIYNFNTKRFETEYEGDIWYTTRFENSKYAEYKTLDVYTKKNKLVKPLINVRVS